MTDIDSELIYGIMKNIQSDVALLKDGQSNIKREIISVRKQLHAMQGDSLRQEQIIASMQLDIERIKTRLDLVDA